MTEQPSAHSTLRAQAKIWLFDWRSIGGCFVEEDNGGLTAWRNVPEGDYDEDRSDEDRLLNDLRDNAALHAAVLKLTLEEGLFRPSQRAHDA